MPDGFDMDLDELFEAGLGYLLDGFDRELRSSGPPTKSSERSRGNVLEGGA